MSEPTLESLRAQDAHLYDPARFHYLEVLSRRLQTQPATVQKVLALRLSAAVSDYAGRAMSAPAGSEAAKAMPPTRSALAQLNRELTARAQSDADGVLLSDGANLSDMKSVRQFSEVWSKISADQQVVQALHRAPENAGPLNSQKLMLRSLDLMRTLSPDYLRRFISHMDSLLWLEGANTKPVRSVARKSRAAKTKP
ncbi:MAG: DUF2894 domain-containing protein [Acidovorax sp.]|nr:DUF2894 domain-containing protein [Acidovorax sp.]